jgi:hypothetical protein
MLFLTGKRFRFELAKIAEIPKFKSNQMRQESRLGV